MDLFAGTDGGIVGNQTGKIPVGHLLSQLLCPLPYRSLLTGTDAAAIGNGVRD